MNRRIVVHCRLYIGSCSSETSQVLKTIPTRTKVSFYFVRKALANVLGNSLWEVSWDLYRLFLSFMLTIPDGSRAILPPLFFRPSQHLSWDVLLNLHPKLILVLQDFKFKKEK